MRTSRRLVLSLSLAAAFAVTPAHADHPVTAPIAGAGGTATASDSFGLGGSGGCSAAVVLELDELTQSISPPGVSGKAVAHGYSLCTGDVNRSTFSVHLLKNGVLVDNEPCGNVDECYTSTSVTFGPGDQLVAKTFQVYTTPLQFDFATPEFCVINTSTNAACHAVTRPFPDA